MITNLPRVRGSLCKTKQPHYAHWEHKRARDAHGRARHQPHRQHREEPSMPTNESTIAAPKQSAPHKKSQRAESGCTTISIAIKPTTILNKPTLNHRRLPSKEDGHQRGPSKNTSLVIKKTRPKRRSDLRESRHGGEPDAGCSRSEGAQIGSNTHRDMIDFRG